MGIVGRNRADAELLIGRMEARSCLIEETRHRKSTEAARKKAARLFLLLLTLLTVLGHYLYFTSPGWVVVNRNGDIDGLTNRARATLQGKRFWRDQLQEVHREIQWDETGPLRYAANEHSRQWPGRKVVREMEGLYRRYPQIRSSDADLRTEEATIGRVNPTRWIQLTGHLEEMRRKRFQELQGILPVVEAKAG